MGKSVLQEQKRKTLKERENLGERRGTCVRESTVSSEGKEQFSSQGVQSLS